MPILPFMLCIGDAESYRGGLFTPAVVEVKVRIWDLISVCFRLNGINSIYFMLAFLYLMRHTNMKRRLSIICSCNLPRGVYGSRESKPHSLH